MEEQLHLQIRGMHCANCATRIEKVISKMDGVSDIEVNLATETGRISFDQSRTSVAKIFQKMNSLGFKAQTIPKNNRRNGRTEQRYMLWMLIASMILTFPLALVMLVHLNVPTTFLVPSFLLHPYTQFALAFPIQFIIGSIFYERAWGALRQGETNMDVLVVLSTTTAFLYSYYLMVTTPAPTVPILYYDTSAFIITFILLGRYIEIRTKQKTTSALEKLYKVQTNHAAVISKGKEVQTPIEYVQPGDIVLVRAGERVPIDGQVTSGVSTVDEALLTGENLPVSKRRNSLVYAGTMNQQGVLYVTVTKKSSQTVLAHIINTVEKAQLSKAPIQQIADRFTSIFIPVVLVIATISFMLSFFFLQPGDVNEAVLKVIAVLIIACPCALGLATPTSIMVGSGRAAEQGILFKEGKNIELLGKCTDIIFDKTGTITKGEPHVTNVYIHMPDDEQFFKMVGALEKQTNHPLGKAIYQYALKKVREFPEAKNVEIMPGEGIRGHVFEKKVALIPSSYFYHDIPREAQRLEREWKQAGKTVILVAITGKFAGLLAITDKIKISAEVTVKRLQDMGFNVLLATGDHPQAARVVANEIGIRQVYASCTPAKKAALIESLQKVNRRVIMVGDGINDAPALATADVGIALGTGADIALATGDISLVQGELKRVVEAIILSKKTITNIKQNLSWAFFYNMIMIPFAMFGIIAPWLAAATMAFSSITVVFNALRLKYVKI